VSSGWNGPLEKIDDFRWRIPRSYANGMRVDGIIYADDKLIQQVRADQAPQQVANVAHLPGLVGPSMAMPDIHWGYGFPIGGVAAMDLEEGVVSPGGVGYDINCGVRLLRSDLQAAEIRKYLDALVLRLYQNIPCGVGASGKLKLSARDERTVLERGSSWAVEQGFGWNSDVEYTEDRGCLKGADPAALSPRALERGRPQLGTLGSGNHFLEIQEVVDIYDEEAAKVFGLQPGQAVVMIHSGSRGLGYQVCDDNLDRMVKAMPRYGIHLPDQQLSSVPVRSPEGKQYLAAMAAAANYAWTNRQLITHWVRESFEQVLGRSAGEMGMRQIYDVAHNIAKFETHRVDGQERPVLVHRKGATRAFGPGEPEVPESYREVGQPVIIPGDMGTASYLLAGTRQAMEQSFGSTCHGAGRVMSRHAAVRAGKGRRMVEEMSRMGVIVRSRDSKTLLEEAPEAYKNIDQVVQVVHGAGLSRKVARMKPLGVIKG